MDKIITTDLGFIRKVLDTAPAIGVDEHGVWLLDLRVGNYRWFVEATLGEDAAWHVLSMTLKAS